MKNNVRSDKNDGNIDNQLIIYMRSHNAEKTMRRAIDSVLAQNFCGFRPIFILTHYDSDDRTSAIIDEYASTYDWINPIRIKSSHLSYFSPLYEVLCQYPDDGWYFYLDADDEYSPSFFEKMLAFVETNKLDVAACGVDLVDVATGQKIGDRSLSDSLVIEREKFAELFPQYRRFYMEVWGKLYRLSLLREWFKDVEKGCAQYSKTDFLHTLGIISNARRIGVLSKNLYRYYRSPTTQTSIFDPLIHASVPEHLELIRRWLRQFGEISDQNEEFIAAINLGWCERLLNTLENANLSNEMKLKYITGTFGHDEVRGILAHEQFSSQYHNLAACGELIKRVKAYILDLGGNWEDVQCGCVRA